MTNTIIKEIKEREFQKYLKSPVAVHRLRINRINKKEARKQFDWVCKETIVLMEEAIEKEFNIILNDKEGFWINAITKELCYRQRIIGQIKIEDGEIVNTNNSKNTIKDDRECKICGKKLSEHSSFSDNHTHISKEVKKK